MQLIGAGLPRTGTGSTRKALELLGYRCFHMETLTRLKRQESAMWRDVFDGSAAHRWEALFAGYDATIDFPGCMFYEELAERFPDAKVILNIRDPEDWLESFDRLVRTSRRMSRLAAFGRGRQMSRMIDAMFDRMFHAPIVRQRAIDIFKRHNDRVRETVPSDRLLVYRVTQGWRPLCKLVGKKVPTVPFPHDNTIDEMSRRVRDIFSGHTEFREG